MPFDYIEPTTVSEARERMMELVIGMRRIENQLSDRNKKDFDGKRLSAHSYWTWNAKAKHVLSKMQEEYVRLRYWMKENGDTEKILAETLFTMLSLPDTATDQEIALCCRSSGYFRKLYVEKFGEVP